MDCAWGSPSGPNVSWSGQRARCVPSKTPAESLAKRCAAPDGVRNPHARGAGTAAALWKSDRSSIIRRLPCSCRRLPLDLPSADLSHPGWQSPSRRAYLQQGPGPARAPRLSSPGSHRAQQPRRASHSRRTQACLILRLPQLPQSRPRKLLPGTLRRSRRLPSARRTRAVPIRATEPGPKCQKQENSGAA
jgi:hypothetical protein